jgi:hypothetical protein
VAWAIGVATGLHHSRTVTSPDVSNGPGIELWIIPRAGAESPDGGTKLAELPGNTGSFNAAIPADVDTTGDVTVLLWCNPVATPMAHATQSPA